MNPFELTKDQYGNTTVRIKSECVVLTREEARRIEERFIGISGENAKLRELVIRMHPICIQGKRCTFADRIYIVKTMHELGIEAEQ